jgi:hypothetical protein
MCMFLEDGLAVGSERGSDEGKGQRCEEVVGRGEVRCQEASGGPKHLDKQRTVGGEVRGWMQRAVESGRAVSWSWSWSRSWWECAQAGVTPARGGGESSCRPPCKRPHGSCRANGRPQLRRESSADPHGQQPNVSGDKLRS